MARKQNWPAYDQTRDIKALERRIRSLETSAKGSEWYDYAVIWSAATTAPAIGTGKLDGKYQRIGSTCIYQVALTATASTTFGSGQWSFPLPFPSRPFTNANAFVSAGDALAYDASTGNGYPGIALVDIVLQAVTVWCGQPGPPATSAAPFTWTTSDILTFSATYQVAEGY